MGRQLATALLCAVGAASPALATSAFTTREISPDPTWHATQGAFRATGTSLASAQGNAAALSGLGSSGLALSHLSWGEGLARDWLAAGSPVGGAFAVGLDGGWVHAGALPAYDADGFLLGEIRPSEWSLGGSAAWDAPGPLDAGLGARYHRLEDPTEPIGLWTGSAGLRLDRACFALGLAANDFGRKVSGLQGEWDAPTSWVVGAEGRLPDRRWSLAATLVTRPDGTGRLSVGTSLRPVPWMELLGGYSGAAKGPSAEPLWGAGLSFAPRNVGVAYAVQSAAGFGLTHQIGLSLQHRSPR